MGGLGNGRRGGRSPPLMIAALIACILVLGFNYWVSSSRNLELQTKLYELEGQVRRGAAERGAVEMKKNEFQEEIQRQKQQISHMENLYKKQLEGAQNICSQDKGTLQQNISSSTKTLQELKVQLNWLNDEMEKLQKELQSCQGNINTLNKKLTYDMTHCQSQVLSQKEICDERVAAVKLEVQKKMEKLTPGVSTQENPVKGTAKDHGTAATGAVTVKALNNTSSLVQPKEKSPELLTNDIITDKVELSPVKDLSKTESKPAPSAAAVKQDMLPPLDGAVKLQDGKGATSKQLDNNLTEDKDMEVMDVHEEAAQAEEADPVLEGMLTGPVRPDEALTGQKLDEGDEYDMEDQVVGGADLEKQQQSKPPENIDKDMEEELADYNGDDENEGEFEADKQAELAQN